MYESYFGVKKNPFQMAPDPEFLFLTAQHREALAGLIYAVVSRKGFGVLTGDAGTGKTTLLARTLRSVSSRQFRSSIVFHPTLTTSEFLEAALIDFGMTNLPESKARRLALLQQFLVKSRDEGLICVLIVDEAHKLSPDVLEEIRLLGNLDYGNEKLLQILLVGQTELDHILNRHDLRQLKQRIAVRLAIQPLRAFDIEPYIRFRWTKAGGPIPMPFSSSVIDEIGRVAKGIPRVINTVCDSALMLAFAERQRAVTATHVREAAADLQLFAASDAALQSGVMPDPEGSGLRLKIGSAPPANGNDRANGIEGGERLAPVDNQRKANGVPVPANAGDEVRRERPKTGGVSGQQDAVSLGVPNGVSRNASGATPVPAPIRIAGFEVPGRNTFSLRRWAKRLINSE